MRQRKPFTKETPWSSVSKRRRPFPVVCTLSVRQRPFWRSLLVRALRGSNRRGVSGALSVTDEGHDRPAKKEDVSSALSRLRALRQLSSCMLPWIGHWARALTRALSVPLHAFSPLLPRSMTASLSLGRPWRHLVPSWLKSMGLRVFPTRFLCGHDHADPHRSPHSLFLPLFPLATRLTS